MADARTNLSAEVDAEARRHLGELVYDDRHPAQRPAVRGAQPRAADRPLRARTRAAPIAYAALADEFRARHGPARAAAREPQAVVGMTVRPERAPGPRSRPRRAHPAAHRRAARPGRDPARPHPAEPAPAAACASTRPSSRRSTASIREHGVLQPILVTETLDGYQLVAGERRCARPRAAGLERIPAIVRQLDDRRPARDRPRREPPARGPRPDRGGPRLPPAHRRVRLQPGATSPTRVGRARSTVANTLRLLDLAPDVQAAVVDGRLTEGHGRALGGLSVEHQEHVVGSVIDQDLSVRQTEELVRRLREPRDADARRRRRPRPAATRTWSASRRTCAGRSARRSAWPGSRRGGRIVIEYYSDEELGRLYERLTGGTA